ncbi:WG repeat-containing protein [Paenibacillus albidus]|uniref:WG repeat-containing protein n=1 Tax=Paenibacillus albidus TaxID=2041023 RepID=UPI003570C8FC
MVRFNRCSSADIPNPSSTEKGTGLYPFWSEKFQLHGYLNSLGQVIIEPEYSPASFFDDSGVAEVYKNDVRGFIDASNHYYEL